MATYTTAQMRAVGVPPAAMSGASTPGDVMFEYILDGTKRAIAATDVVHMHDIPANCGFIVRAAAVTILAPGPAGGLVSVGINGTPVTGLTAWSTADPAGTESVKLATGANTVITGGTPSNLSLQQTVAGLGNGKIKVRVFGEYLDS